MALLDTLDRWIDETPPVDQPSRFGNKAYRTWYAKLDQVRLVRAQGGPGQWKDYYGSRWGKVICQNGSFIYLNYKIILCPSQSFGNCRCGYPIPCIRLLIKSFC